MDDSVTKAIEVVFEKTRGKKKIVPVEEHELIYDSSSETLEPVYFWILDLMNNRFSGKVEKLIDNFNSSPGSGHFAELGGRKSIMQKNVSEQMVTINQIIKSIINLLYDLKEFEIRLKHYDDANSKEKGIAEGGTLALKEVWMNSVDMKRGAGSINALASGNLQFVTLRDAFMMANSIKDVEKIDLNERVKRMLKSRVSEFLAWKERSEKELKSRFNIQKNYLKSQVNSLQLSARWVKPYLKAASELEMKESGTSPDLVKTFNTIILELTLFGKNEYDVMEAINTAVLPRGLKKPKRKYYSVVVINFYFRGIPQKVSQRGDYTFGGKATVNFRAYSLNEEEINAFEQVLKKSDVSDVLKLAEGATTESLDVLKEEIEHFIKTDEVKKEKEKEKNNDINPFSALFSPFFERKEEKKNTEEKEVDVNKIKKDSYEESLVRILAEQNAREICFSLFDIYKKAHGMASHDSPFE